MRISAALDRVPNTPEPTPTVDAAGTHSRLGHSSRTWGKRYAFAVATVLIASALTWLVWSRIKPQVSPLFFVAVMTAAWYGGLGPGLLATALSGFLSIYIFSDPVFSLKVGADDFLRVGVFVIAAVVISALANGRRRAEEALRAAHGDLERRVAERTNELAAVNLSLGREVTERRGAQQKLVEHQARLQDLTAEVVLAEQRERRRMAERLHDDLGQLLALTQIRIGAIPAIEDAAKRSVECEAVEKLIEEAIGRTRSITCELSPPVLYELGLVAAVEWLVERFGQQCDVPISMTHQGVFDGLPEEIGVTLFHVTRELLANVIKHARAGEVSVLLRASSGELSAIVADDGVGFDPSLVGPARASSSFGLFSVRERLRRHGGSLNILTEPGRGTQATVTLPVSPTKAQTK